MAKKVANSNKTRQLATNTDKIANIDTSKVIDIQSIRVRNSFLEARTQLIKKFLDSKIKRDYYKEFIYPTPPYTSQFYRELYNYCGVATRVVDIAPKETWKAIPYIYETENRNRNTAFEKAIIDLFANVKLKFLQKIFTADCLAGVARYGGVVIGLNDGRSLDQPVTNVDIYGDLIPLDRKLDVLYLRPFDEMSCIVTDVVEDQSNPRYMHPQYYELRQPILTQAGDGNVPDTTLMNPIRVHWTRVVHFIDMPADGSDFLHIPRMQNVIPHIWDIRKIVGASAEGYYQGAFPGISIEALSELFSQGYSPEFDEASIQDQMYKYANGQQRYIALKGAKANTLAPNVADPSPHIESSLKLLCASIDWPLKTFLGSESGHLASQEDSKKVQATVESRRVNIGDMGRLRPVIDRLVTYGCLPKPKKYICEWEDPSAQMNKEQADVSLKRSQALAQYAGSNAISVMGPKMFLTSVLKMTEEQADNAMKEADEKKKKIAPINPNPQKPGGQAKGKSSSKSTGRPKGNPGS